MLTGLPSFPVSQTDCVVESEHVNTTPHLTTHTKNNHCCHRPCMKLSTFPSRLFCCLTEEPLSLTAAPTQFLSPCAESCTDCASQDALIPALAPCIYAGPHRQYRSLVWDGVLQSGGASGVAGPVEKTWRGGRAAPAKREPLHPHRLHHVGGLAHPCFLLGRILNGNNTVEVGC